jgi:four helix bundle protein
MLAEAVGMAAVTRFEDLDAWRLSVDLRDEIDRMTETGPVARDFEFRDQIRDAAASAPRNISEGWGRFNPRENAQFVRWAKGSLAETQTHLLHGKGRRYFSEEDFERAWNLSRRAIGATTRYWQYLDSCDGEVPGQPPTRRPKRSTR